MRIFFHFFLAFLTYEFCFDFDLPVEYHLVSMKQFYIVVPKLIHYSKLVNEEGVIVGQKSTT